MSRTDPALRDLILLLATGGLHLVFENVLHAKGPFLAVAGLVWLGWTVHRWREQPDLPVRWGLTLRGWGPAALAATAGTLPAAACLVWLGSRLGHPVPWHVAGLAVAYLPWALVQQVALNGILLGGLERLAPPAAAVAASGLLFALAHLPDPVLAGLTLAGGMLWTALFRRHRTVWPLAVSHSILGALAYTAVLGRDPWPVLLGLL